MTNYRRLFRPGECYFFTVVTYERRSWLCLEKARRLLKEAIIKIRKQHEFILEAFVLLPDHLHCLMRLPDGDADFSSRWRLIKDYISKHRDPGWMADSGSASRMVRREVTLWQRRFWEHCIRNDEDWRRHCNYIHYNPVKHGLCTAPRLWPYSSFHRFVREGKYEWDWGSQIGPEGIVDMNIE